VVGEVFHPDAEPLAEGVEVLAEASEAEAVEALVAEAPVGAGNPENL